jgi:signal transduction histidine kinase/ActR/RegA family two-component response regulator
MKPLETRRLTFLYIAALSMVALLTMAGQWMVQRSLQRVEGDAEIVNIAGRQRMLSQRLPRLILELQSSPTSSREVAIRDELRQGFERWENSQQALEHGSTDLDWSGKNSPMISRMFDELRPHFDALREVVRLALVSDQPMDDEAQLRMSQASDAFLLGMDAIVSRYAIEANERVARLKWIERGLLIATLFVLIGEGLFIFSPAVNSLRKTLGQLHSTSQQLTSAKEIAEAANREKTAFLTRLSHELRTPIHGLLGMLSQLRRTKLLPSQQRRLGLSQQAAQTLHSLVNDLLDVAGIEAGMQPKIHEKPTKIASLIRGAVDLMRPAAQAKGLALTSQFDPNLPKWMATDADRIRQIVYNLLQNAIRYTAQGSIDVKARCEMIDGQSNFVLDVSDTGPGIAATEQSKIFGSFVRLEHDQPSPVFGPGLGLGLPITAAVVKALGGKIEVSSQLGQGTCFTVRLPWKDGKPNDIRRRKKPRSAKPVTARGLALIVDDSEINRVVMRDYLRRLGFEVAEAADAVEAYKFCLSSQPQWIILDRHLQQSDGLELIDKIRADVQSDSVPKILLVTADIYFRETDLNPNLGNICVLHKPLKFNELQEALGVDPKPDESDSFEQLKKKLRAMLGPQLDNDWRQLQSAYQAGDFRMVGLISHRMRGASANAGYAELDELCLALEESAVAADPSACEQKIAGLREQITQLKRHFSLNDSQVGIV